MGFYSQITFNSQLHDDGFSSTEINEHELMQKYEHDFMFRSNIDIQCKHDIETVINLASESSPLGKINALAAFFGMRLPFDYGIFQIRCWIAPLFFDHETGELLSSSISTDKALQPIINYYRHGHTDKWWELLGRLIETHDFAGLLDRVDQKSWYTGVSSLYQSFYTLHDFLWIELMEKVVENKTNQEIVAMIKSCERLNFETAQKIAKELNNSAADEIFAYYYNYVFDEYGILRQFANDPAWAELSEQAKQEIKNVPDGIPFFNYYLSVRAEEKKKLIASRKENYTVGLGISDFY
jgi:hypothetical protein